MFLDVIYDVLHQFLQIFWKSCFIRFQTGTDLFFEFLFQFWERQTETVPHPLDQSRYLQNETINNLDICLSIVRAVVKGAVSRYCACAKPRAEWVFAEAIETLALVVYAFFVCVCFQRHTQTTLSGQAVSPVCKGSIHISTSQLEVHHFKSI